MAGNIYPGISAKNIPFGTKSIIECETKVANEIKRLNPNKTITINESNGVFAPSLKIAREALEKLKMPEGWSVNRDNKCIQASIEDECGALHIFRIRFEIYS